MPVCFSGCLKECKRCASHLTDAVSLVRHPMRYVFGPVPSRRLGRSLGIDTVPLKTCNWNCVYCQLGHTVPVVCQRRAWFPVADILEEVRRVLDSSVADSIDWITFVGSGEGTLHSGIGALIREVRQFSKIPVAVITNGSLLYRPEVREELAAAQAVLPTLDAGEPKLYRRVNRAHPSLPFEQHVRGLRDFSRMFTGKLWLEVMMVRGLNDTEAALKQLVTVLDGIDVDEIHLTTPTRPPAEMWVEPTDREGLMRAQSILGPRARPTRDLPQDVQASAGVDACESIINVVARHPMRKNQLCRLLAISPELLDEALQTLLREHRVQLVDRLGEEFVAVAGGRYPPLHSRVSK